VEHIGVFSSSSGAQKALGGEIFAAEPSGNEDSSSEEESASEESPDGGAAEDEEDDSSDEEDELAADLVAASSSAEQARTDRKEAAASWSFANALRAVQLADQGKYAVTSLQQKIALRAKQTGRQAVLPELMATAPESLKRPRSPDHEESEPAPKRIAGAASTVSSRATPAPAEEVFEDLKLSRPLLASVKQLGWTKPTPIQSRAIPVAMQGRDLLGSAVTGSGKTGAFLLPVMERLLYRDRSTPATRVLIVLPTRELATQCYEVALKLGGSTDIRCALVVGGMSSKLQSAELRTRPDIVIATPGRLLDHMLNSPSVDCDDVDVLVLDEADRLLDMGFEKEVTELVKLCPKGRQTLLFSATMNKSLEGLVKLSLRHPVEVSADPLYDMASTLQQEFVRVRQERERDREALILALVSRGFHDGTIVFCQRKREAHHLAIVLGLAGVSVTELHGNLSQKQRLEALETFRGGVAGVLVATDVAGRGLDIRGVKTVINLDMPRDLTTYVHRVGRTARAGREGRSITLVDERARPIMREAVRRAKRNVKSRTIPPEVVDRCRAVIAEMGPDIAAILEEEKLEREERLADMEARRAENFAVHEDEIYARPAKTWAVTPAEKVSIRQAAKEATTAPEAAEPEELTVRERKQKKLEEIRAARAAAKAAKDKKIHRMSRAKRRRMEVRQETGRQLSELNKAAQSVATNEDDAAELARSQVKRKKLLGVLPESQHAAARKTKREARRAAALMGLAPSKVEKEVSKTVTTASRSLRKLKGDAGMRMRAAMKAAGGDAVSMATHRFHRSADLGAAAAEAFNDDGLVKSHRRASLGRGAHETDQLMRRGPQTAPPSGDKEAPAKAGGLRKGGKPGHHTFKSKARHKRR
jgi:ATP-dependent RNA helicase DDX27